MNWSDRITEVAHQFAQFVTYGIIAVIIVGGLLLTRKPLSVADSLRSQNEELQAKIERIKRDTAVLVRNQARFHNDPDFIELVARRHHRMFPGEVMFTIED